MLLIAVYQTGYNFSVPLSQGKELIFYPSTLKKGKKKDWRINYIKYIFISVAVVNGNSHIGLSILNFENQFLPVDVKQKCMKWICGETPHKSKGKRVEKMIFDPEEKVSYFLRNWEERCEMWLKCFISPYQKNFRRESNTLFYYVIYHSKKRQITLI